MNDFLNLLAVAANGSNTTTIPAEVLQALAKEQMEKTVWIIALIVILVGILYFTFAHAKIIDKIKENRAKRRKNKISKAKQKDIEHLHEIKKKNKRK